MDILFKLKPIESLKELGWKIGKLHISRENALGIHRIHTNFLNAGYILGIQVEHGVVVNKGRKELFFSDEIIADRVKLVKMRDCWGQGFYIVGDRINIMDKNGNTIELDKSEIVKLISEISVKITI